MLDAETGHELWMIGLEAGPVAGGLAFAPDGKTIVSGRGGVLSFIDAQTGRLR